MLRLDDHLVRKADEFGRACHTYAVDFHINVIEVAPQVDRPKYGLPPLHNIQCIPYEGILHTSTHQAHSS